MQEEKKRRGRPATGRVRNKQVSAQVTEEERQKIKEYAKSKNYTIADLLLKSIEKNI